MSNTLRLSGSLPSRPTAPQAKGAYYFATAIAEIFTVNFGVLTGAGVAAKYFTCADASGAVYFWFNTGASVDPAPGGRGIAVSVLAGDAASALATKLAAVVDASFSFSALGTLVTVTNAATGARTNAGAGNSGTVVTTTQNGNAADTVYESDGIGWLTRGDLPHDEIVGRSEGLLTDRPSPGNMVGYVYYGTDSTASYEAFPTGWFTLP